MVDPASPHRTVAFAPVGEARSPRTRTALAPDRPRHPTFRDGPTMKRVLFVCIENANRSQMAEAFARIHGGDAVEALSAGSRPSGVINPKAIRFRSELGYDLSGHD